MKVFFFSYRLILLLILGENCFNFFKKSIFFCRPSTGNRNVEGTLPADKSFLIKVILAEMQGMKIGMEIFVNLKHYVEFNCNDFTFKKNLVL